MVDVRRPSTSRSSPSRSGFLEWHRDHRAHPVASNGETDSVDRTSICRLADRGIEPAESRETIWRNRYAFKSHRSNRSKAFTGTWVAEFCVLRLYELSLVQRAGDGICQPAAREEFSVRHAAHPHGKLDSATTLAGHLEARAAWNRELAPIATETCGVDGLQ